MFKLPNIIAFLVIIGGLGGWAYFFVSDKDARKSASYMAQIRTLENLPENSPQNSAQPESGSADRAPAAVSPVSAFAKFLETDDGKKFIANKKITENISEKISPEDNPKKKDYDYELSRLVGGNENKDTIRGLLVEKMYPSQDQDQLLSINASLLEKLREHPEVSVEDIWNTMNTLDENRIEEKTHMLFLMKQVALDERVRSKIAGMISNELDQGSLYKFGNDYAIQSIELLTSMTDNPEVRKSLFNTAIHKHPDPNFAELAVAQLGEPQ